MLSILPSYGSPQISYTLFSWLKLRKFLYIFLRKQGQLVKNYSCFPRSDLPTCLFCCSHLPPFLLLQSSVPAYFNPPLPVCPTWVMVNILELPVIHTAQCSTCAVGSPPCLEPIQGLHHAIFSFFFLNHSSPKLESFPWASKCSLVTVI